MPKKDIEFPIGITVRLSEATHGALVRIAKEDRRPPATVTRMLVEEICDSMGSKPLHEILSAIRQAGGKGKK